MNRIMKIIFDKVNEVINLDEEILETLGRPKQVQLLINEERKMLLIRACDIDAQQAVVVPDKPNITLEIGASSFLKKIDRLMKWEHYEKHLCRGEYLPTQQVILFNLNNSR